MRVRTECKGERFTCTDKDKCEKRYRGGVVIFYLFGMNIAYLGRKVDEYRPGCSCEMKQGKRSKLKWSQSIVFNAWSSATKLRVSKKQQTSFTALEMNKRSFMTPLVVKRI